jgi:WD40 repeat protein/GGDEF domain-containing protein
MSDELNDLFTRMKAQQHAHDQAQQQPPMSFWTQPPPQPQHGYQPPSVSSPLFSPPAEMPQPHHPSHVISPASRASPFQTPGAHAQSQDQNRANSLLNLLRSNGSQPPAEGGLMSSLQNVQKPDTMQRTNSAQQSNMLSASDFVASLQRRPSAQSTTSSAAPEAAKSFESTAGQANTQDFLLNLLTKPSKLASPAASQVGGNPADANKKPNEASTVNRLAQSLAEASIASAESPQPELASLTPLVSPPTTIALEAPQPTKGGIFNYVNPFDQLHQSSPLNRTPQPQAQEKRIEILKHDRAVSDNLNGELGAPAAKTRKLSSSNKKPVHQAVESAKTPQSVSKKLEEVSAQVEDQVAQALANATKQETSLVKAKEVVVPVVEKQAGDETVDTDWSTAEDEDAKQEEDAKVEVFNFPMKPFVTLQLQSSRVARPFRPSTWESATPIARLKKEFSHDDRALATASQSHIIYAVVPSEKKPDTGLKIIRQEDGKNKHVWAKAGERLCNVQVSSVTQGDVESVLATGVNGTIFYTTLAKSRGDLFDDDNVEAQGFIMSPPPNSDEPSSSSTFGTSSAIKTRAKLSNRHSDQYFAVARGRQIHLIAPEIVKDRAYTDHKTHIVQTEKYLSEHSLSINTAKAGKDFCFSEDDTTLISLDKVGKVKFWDIRALTSAIDSVNQGSYDKAPRNELKEPIYSFAAGASPLHPDDKMSPSSVMLLDKDRPCAKGVALRYLLVGFQQNHILQLWDLGLGKCVQELRFPESPGSTNAMCTVNYHPKTGILCVSHPGRNSIYFIHLSAPRYNLPPLSQAAYIGLLAAQDQSLPRPDSTAIMSGMREYSLGKVGELRSVDMLKTPFPTGNVPDDAAFETLFELYIEHSKGVVGMLIKRDDLGWDAKGKMVKPKDAIEAGLVKVGELNPPRPAESTTASQPEILQRQPAKSKKDREVAKPEPKSEPKVQAKEDAQPTPVPASNDNTSLPAHFKQIPEAPSATNPPIMTAEDYSMAAQKPKAPAKEREVEVEKPAIVQEPAAKPQPSPKKSNAKVAAPNVADSNVQDVLAKEFAALYQKLDQDKRIADASGAAKQDAILRLVSSTLTENVENTLHKIVSASIESKVIPALTSNTSKVIERKLAETLNTQVSESVAKELKATLPVAISAALRDNHVTRALSTHIVDEVSKQVKMDMGGLVQRSMQTVQTNMASQLTQSSHSLHKAIVDVESKLGASLHQVSEHQLQQNAMLSQLSASVRELTSLVHSMKEEQGRIASQVSQQSTPQALTAPVQREAEIEAVAPQSEEPTEVERLTQMLRNAEYQQATIEWLQSANQAELFDHLFKFLNPLYLQQVSPLVALSVSAAITSSFETNVELRLEWLGTIVSNIDASVSSIHRKQTLPFHCTDLNHQDSDIRDVAPKIMEVLYQRLQGAYMQLAEMEPRDDNALRKMVALTRQIADVRRSL